MKSYYDFVDEFFNNWKGDEISKAITEIEFLFNSSHINSRFLRDLSDRVSVIEKKLKIKKGEKK